MKFMARFNSTNMIMMGPGMHMMMPGMGIGGMANMGMGPGMGQSPAGQAEMHIENKPADPPADAAPAPAPDAAPPAREGAFAGSPVPSRGGAQVAGFIAVPNVNQNQIACIGDSNCPGNMKCCSHDMNVYVHDGGYMFRNRNPTYGYCIEPTTNAMNTKSLKYASQ